MRIKEIKFENYRNLTDAKIAFCPGANYIIGENGVGKTNFLDSLDCIFVRKRFEDADFYDRQTPIRIELALTADGEEGEDIRLTVRQKCGASPRVRLAGNNGRVPPDLANRIHFLNFGKLYEYPCPFGEGESDLADRFLCGLSPSLYERFSDDNALKRHIFRFLGGLNAAKHPDRYSVNKYSVTILYALLREICLAALKGGWREEAECILAFDEPEVHLYSFLQRAFMKVVREIASGENAHFNYILRALTGVERFSAQILVISHSDRIIGKNHKEIIRFYQKDGGVAIRSGSTLSFGSSASEKHLLMRFPYFSEALFSKCVLFVEGECEAGAFPVFARMAGVDVDALSISIVNAGSESSMIPLMKLFEKFGINVIGVKDRDVFTYDEGKYEREKEWIQSGKLFLTHYYDFEEEIYECIADRDKLSSVLKEEGIRLSNPVSGNAVAKIVKHYALEEGKYDFAKCSLSQIHKDRQMSKIFYLAKLKECKSILNGESLAAACPRVPDVYRAVIEAAKNKAL